MFKKLIALSGLLLTLSSLPLLAQQTATPDAQTGQRMGKGRGMQQHQAADPTVRAQRMTDQMTKQLGLDEATSKKVYDVALARAQKVDAIQKGTDDNKAKNQALQANAEDFKSKLKGVLTPDQFTKFESMKGRMGRGRGNGGSTDNSDQK
ncbi:DUF4890 domain-containing protein [Spirosoma foliorum]|uniref:DUF4890 domain-containing protein n=1 Tax=Spirosoma foliorum TaxID=2710596 RepID=A0A7G5GV68_9BACT|nr:DUF4890 domain-containing protein [Spirosoma foliorum]QMW02760.1 DUF4890 domain-containing protein [Spirosoma foliorum]